MNKGPEKPSLTVMLIFSASEHRYLPVTIKDAECYHLLYTNFLEVGLFENGWMKTETFFECIANVY